ncbi:MAG: hypothetical protein ACI4UF_09835, partial [Thermoguttaceae bacterium]
MIIGISDSEVVQISRFHDFSGQHRREPVVFVRFASVKPELLGAWQFSIFCGGSLERFGHQVGTV